MRISKVQIKKLIILCILLSLCLLSYGCKNSQQTKEGSSSVVAGTSWIGGDKSQMIFNEDGTFIWAQTENVFDDNFYAGTYKFFIGEEALDYLSKQGEQYKDIKDNMKRYYESNNQYSQENAVCYSFDHESFILDGEEQLSEKKLTHYFGFLLEDGTYLDVANLTTGTYYGFTKQEAYKAKS